MIVVMLLIGFMVVVVVVMVVMCGLDVMGSRREGGGGRRTVRAPLGGARWRLGFALAVVDGGHGRRRRCDWRTTDGVIVFVVVAGHCDRCDDFQNAD